MVFRYRAARSAALVLSAAAALLVTALPATAETTGEYIGRTAQGSNLRMDGETLRTGLLGLRLTDGTELQTYCVEVDIPAKPGAGLAEAPWSAYPNSAAPFNQNLDKVLWVLHNSYPNVDTNTLGTTVGAKLSTAEAIAGTQAAIWHLTNGATLDNGNAADIRKVYDHLIGSANVGIQARPPASLAIGPSSRLEAAVGKSAGPFTVETTGGQVNLTVQGPEGVAVVDAKGNPLSSVANGGQFWLSAPDGQAAGEATVTASTEADVQTGRLFVGVQTDEVRTQSLIVAASSRADVRAEATAAWRAGAAGQTAAGTPGAPGAQGTALAATGPSVLPALGTAVLLFAAGIGMLLTGRRRRRRVE